MMIAEASAVSEDVASVPLILGLVLMNAVSVYAVWCWRTGWGNGGKRLMRRNPRSWALFVVRLGYTLTPFAISVSCATAFMAALYVFERTDDEAFAWIGLVFVVPMFGAGAWAFKEYVRPSAWRKAPAWVDEFNLQGR